MENIENLTIGKINYSVELKDLNQNELLFYVDNPRVYSVLNINDESPSQEEIEDYLCSMDHVKQLKVSIESNGGLIDPLIVRGGDFTVLEGNSRLAAYRLLARIDPIKWGKVKCRILPNGIEEKAIFALLGQYHIIGRKDWDPYEQAYYLYRRTVETRLPIDYIATELGIPKRKASNMIDVIGFMIENDDLNKKNWSHYEEYLKSGGIKTFREAIPELDDQIAEAIKKGEIREASDMRKLGDIGKIAKGGDKQAKKVMQQVSTGEVNIYEAYEKLSDSGKLEDVVKKFKGFKTYINDESVERQIKVSTETYNAVQFEITKIIKRLQQLEDKKGK